MQYTIDPGRVEVGVDEAGRGPLACSVFAGAVILPPLNEIPPSILSLIQDSKKMTKKKRAVARAWIENNVVDWAVGECTHTEIDEMNILKASHLAMRRAILSLSEPFSHIAIDGNSFTPEEIAVPYTTVVKGDSKYTHIAAASVLAKEHHDEHVTFIAQSSEELGVYGWERNMAYPTKEHYSALKKYGPTPYHRMSFNLKL